ncbi:MAG: FAD linked oxidase domain protein [Thermotogales bacterium 46_20]|nr:MAG: FAD linked oxidase domain protein [Thermotogales bacterium 46_20]
MALLVPFKLFGDAVAAVPRLMTECGVLPSSLEFMDHASISTVCEFMNTDFPFREAGAHLIIEVEGNSKDAIFEEYVSIGEKSLELGGQEVFVADNRNSREKLWKVRKSIAEALAGIRPVHCMEDVSVPTSAIPELISAANSIAEEERVDILSFGHAGDGNVHITFMNPDYPRNEWKQRLERCLDKLYEITISLGGCITGEHGVGLKRKEAFMRITDPALLKILAGLKSVFDPNRVLNPGKIID